MEQSKAAFSRLFEKSLADLVRGIRNNKKNEAKYISQCIQEIKEELKSREMEKKTVAIQKLTYVCFHLSPLFLFFFPESKLTKNNNIKYTILNNQQLINLSINQLIN